MSYHRGLGLELNMQGQTFGKPNTGTVNAGTANTNVAVSDSAWKRFVVVTQLLPLYLAALQRVAVRAGGADRSALLTSMNKASGALAIANAIWRFETQGGKIVPRPWTTSSIQKLGDIAASGGIPTAATLDLIRRTQDAAALNVATQLKVEWGWVAPMTPQAQAARTAELQKAAQAQAARDQAARDQAARDQAARDAVARDQAARDQAARDQAVQAALAQQMEQEQAARQAAAQQEVSLLPPVLPPVIPPSPEEVSGGWIRDVGTMYEHNEDWPDRRRIAAECMRIPPTGDCYPPCPSDTHRDTTGQCVQSLVIPTTTATEEKKMPWGLIGLGLGVAGLAGVGWWMMRKP